MPAPPELAHESVADLGGPLGTRLTTPGRCLTHYGAHRFTLMLSWPTFRPDRVHHRATFVHRLPVEVRPPAPREPESSGPWPDLRQFEAPSTNLLVLS